MKSIELVDNPDESVDIVVNGIPIVNFTRSEIEQISFDLDVIMMEQDLEREVA